MNVLFMTNVPAPYRVDFFNELGKHVNLTVVFEKATSTERDKSWKQYEFKNFHGVILKGMSLDTDTAICPGIIKYVSDSKFDFIICHNFNSPTGMMAIEYMRKHNISYWLESDGGFAKAQGGRGLRERLKRHFIPGAKGYFSSSRENDKYFISYGVHADLIHRYPFTSLKAEDFLPTIPDRKEKEMLKKSLGIREEKCIISVGRFSYLNGKGKGFDTLCKIAEKLDNNTGVYIIGDTPTDEFVQMKQMKGGELDNLHFIDFKKKEDLFQYYRAADLFVLLTRGEAWGLVINEAMANGLPVVTTTKCVAGMELVKDGENGYLVSCEDEHTALKRIKVILSNSELRECMSHKSVSIISDYTIEKMSDSHLEKILDGGVFDYLKKLYRSFYGMEEERIIIAVGQFIYRKGFDVLIRAMHQISCSIGVYIVGGEPTEEYTSMKSNLELVNLHFCGYKSKTELRRMLLASDLFVHPTREDIWGLVVNEAMAAGLPVITTDRCIAGLELVVNGVNGYIIKADDESELSARIDDVLTKNRPQVMGRKAKMKVRQYTLEKMVASHCQFFEG